MIDKPTLIDRARRMMRELERDLRERSQEPEIEAAIREEYAQARQNERTALGFEAWRDEYLTQVAAGWILGCVFVRFLEDNQLIDPPMLAGPDERMGFARDSRDAYFARNPLHSDRHFLEHAFHTVAALPGCGPLFDARHNPLWKVPISPDAAGAMLEAWRSMDPESGRLLLDFTDPVWDTRFLGDLYQDLSESARKTYALLQTPEFVEEFILDRTLTPAIEEFGFREVRLVDPACGSGHFILGAFARLFALWRRHEPGLDARVVTQRVLDQVSGVDLNPYAGAIARFRLLLAALRAAGITRLAAAPDFHLDVAVGDSLLHGPRADGVLTRQGELAISPLHHFYQAEDAEALERILGQRYHAVVGNPPYITVKHRAVGELYRERYGACHRQYSLVVPFMERVFDLAISGDERHPAGYVGMIVANSFMKREFGKKLIEDFIPRCDLTHVIDTSGAYIPGHGTPTVILFGRNRKPVLSTVRTVMGIRGEPSTPDDPAQGLVWRAIVDQVDRPGSQSDFVSVADVPRETFRHHPWSLGGGGAAELKEQIEEGTDHRLAEVMQEIGRSTHTGEDSVYYLEPSACRTLGLFDWSVPLVVGEDVRDYQIIPGSRALFPYDKMTGEPAVIEGSSLARHVWLFRTTLRGRRDYGQTPEERGLRWYDHSMFFRDRFRTPLAIAFAFVATHNHFVLDLGGKVFNRSAPIIKLPPEATEEDHLALLGLLNSSTACFWMKQVLMDRGNGGIGGGIANEEWERFYEHDGTKLKQVPLTEEKPLTLATALDTIAQRLSALAPDQLFSLRWPHAAGIARAHAEWESTRRRIIALQEELDWKCYQLYGLTPQALIFPSGDVPEINLGERAFEIVMARQIAAGELTTAWFERHSSRPITEIPADWPEPYRALVARRIREIEANPQIALIEKPEYKRRWNTEPWNEQLHRALREWLLDRLEDRRHWPQVELISCARLAERVAQDMEFMQVAEIYRGRADFDLTVLVIELAEAEAMPYLSSLRYKPSGMVKRAAWVRTWDLQRREDAIDARVNLPEGDPARLTAAQAAAQKAREVGEIEVPPKYKSTDFLKQTYWRLRGALDVPKERFILYPDCERRGDATPVIGWAGWNHLEQAKALAAFYLEARTEEGWSVAKLKPLLAGLAELIPWLKQWHNDLDSEYDLRMGDYYEGFLDQQLRALELTPADLGE